MGPRPSTILVAVLLIGLLSWTVVHLGSADYRQERLLALLRGDASLASVGLRYWAVAIVGAACAVLLTSRSVVAFRARSST